ncbi:hypothetical protein [Streptosporangium sp. NPDC051022]|uniref:hypothetical protein n=1 Tax=Streptosporangium sp. NPDC051022 TaxID=3155752 RepID=UPI0034226689
MPENDRARRARGHRTDWMALFSGLLFLVSGIIFVSVPDVEATIMLPVLLGGLGLAGLVAILGKVVRRR